MTAYQYSNCDSIFSAAVPKQLSKSCDFMTFLRVAQSLLIDCLPITWQRGIQKIGQGATGQIHEVLLDDSTSFAIKRRLLSVHPNCEELKSQDMPTVVAEISILRLPSIQSCRNIINLVDICWDIYCEDGYNLTRTEVADFSKAVVVPVLVFQKSKWGDLHTFMMHGAEKNPFFSERQLRLLDRNSRCWEHLGRERWKLH